MDVLQSKCFKHAQSVLERIQQKLLKTYFPVSICENSIDFTTYDPQLDYATLAHYKVLLTEVLSTLNLTPAQTMFIIDYLDDIEGCFKIMDLLVTRKSHVGMTIKREQNFGFTKELTQKANSSKNKKEFTYTIQAWCYNSYESCNFDDDISKSYEVLVFLDKFEKTREVIKSRYAKNSTSSEVIGSTVILKFPLYGNTEMTVNYAKLPHFTLCVQSVGIYVWKLIIVSSTATAGEGLLLSIGLAQGGVLKRESLWRELIFIPSHIDQLHPSINENLVNERIELSYGTVGFIYSYIKNFYFGDDTIGYSVDYIFNIINFIMAFFQSCNRIFEKSDIENVKMWLFGDSNNTVLGPDKSSELNDLLLNLILLLTKLGCSNTLSTFWLQRRVWGFMTRNQAELLLHRIPINSIYLIRLSLEIPACVVISGKDQNGVIKHIPYLHKNWSGHSFKDLCLVDHFGEGYMFLVLLRTDKSKSFTVQAQTDTNSFPMRVKNYEIC